MGKNKLKRCLFGLKSLINHNKARNILELNSDDISLNYAARDISKGEELFLDYCSCEKDPGARAQILEGYGIYEEEDGDVLEVEEQFSKLNLDGEGAGAEVEKADEVAEMENSRWFRYSRRAMIRETSPKYN